MEARVKLGIGQNKVNLPFCFAERLGYGLSLIISIKEKQATKTGYKGFRDK